MNTRTPTTSLSLSLSLEQNTKNNFSISISVYSTTTPPRLKSSSSRFVLLYFILNTVIDELDPAPIWFNRVSIQLRFICKPLMFCFGMFLNHRDTYASKREREREFSKERPQAWRTCYHLQGTSKFPYI